MTVYVCSVHDAACAEVPVGLRCAGCPERPRQARPFQGLRMLTQAELLDLVNIYYEGNIDPVLAIRKFCEVNGLGEPS